MQVKGTRTWAGAGGTEGRSLCAELAELGSPLDVWDEEMSPGSFGDGSTRHTSEVIGKEER